MKNKNKGPEIPPSGGKYLASRTRIHLENGRADIARIVRARSENFQRRNTHRVFARRNSGFVAEQNRESHTGCFKMDSKHIADPKDEQYEYKERHEEEEEWKIS